MSQPEIVRMQSEPVLVRLCWTEYAVSLDWTWSSGWMTKQQHRCMFLSTKLFCLQLPFPGTLYITAQHICFSSCTRDGQDITVLLKHKQVQAVHKLPSRKRGLLPTLVSCYCVRHLVCRQLALRYITHWQGCCMSTELHPVIMRLCLLAYLKAVLRSMRPLLSKAIASARLVCTMPQVPCWQQCLSQCIKLHWLDTTQVSPVYPLLQKACIGNACADGPNIVL